MKFHNPGYDYYHWMQLQLAIDLYNYGLIEKSWERLFLYVESMKVIRKPRETSEKQKAQQRLFQQLGTLHRTRANLGNIIHDFKLSGFELSDVERGLGVINKLISEVNHDMKMISSTQKDIV